MLSELLLGLVFAVTYWSILPDGTLAIVLALLFVILLYFFGVYDVFHKAVRNKYLFPVLVVVFLGEVLYSFVVMDVTPLLSSAGGILWYFLFFALINVLCERGIFPAVSKGKQGFGWGDAKFGILLGLVLGWPVSFVGLWASVFLGGFVSLLFLLRTNKKQETIPFVPFLSVGAWVALIWGNAIMELVRNMIL
jgi:prepilin signal peptidase PulO-like enzyme (type II secretory pathway)